MVINNKCFIHRKGMNILKTKYLLRFGFHMLSDSNRLVGVVKKMILCRYNKMAEFDFFFFFFEEGEEEEGEVIC